MKKLWNKFDKFDQKYLSQVFVQVHQATGALGVLCQAHCMDLLLEDTGDYTKPKATANHEWICDSMHATIKMVNYTLNRPKLLEKFGKQSKLRLFKPADTRFGT